MDSGNIVLVEPITYRVMLSYREGFCLKMCDFFRVMESRQVRSTDNRSFLAGFPSSLRFQSSATPHFLASNPMLSPAPQGHEVETDLHLDVRT